MGLKLTKHGIVKKKNVVVELRGFIKAGVPTLFERLVSMEAVDTRSHGTGDVTLKRTTGDLLLHRAPGGRCSSRPIIQHRLHAPESHVLVFVIDSTDEEGQMGDVHSLLTDLVRRLSLQDCTFLLLANKQDKDTALSVECIKERIRFDELLKYHEKMGIFGCSALTGEGVDEAMDWMCHELNPSVSTWRGDTYEEEGSRMDETAKPDHKSLLTMFKGTFGSVKRIFTQNTK